jgi:serine/threonine protein kinase
MSQQPDSDQTMMPPKAPAKSLHAPQDGMEIGNNALPAGTRLAEFEIAGLIGEGGFGIVYRAYDHSLHREIALKEYMPSTMAVHTDSVHVTIKSPRHSDTFEAGLRSFVNEARLLARFDHPSLVKVYRFWEDNGTAYMVMPLYQGATLKEFLRTRTTPPDEAWLRSLLSPLLDALEHIHHELCFHRDVAPDNILLLEDGRPLLLDFGAARRAIRGQNTDFTIIAKQHYAPIEQFADNSALQGPWTDLYALAAVVHRAITGEPPPTAASRIGKDSYLPLEQKAAGRYSAEFLRAIDRCQAFRPEDRPQSVVELRTLLGLKASHDGGAGAAARPRRTNHLLAAGIAVAAIATYASVQHIRKADAPPPPAAAASTPRPFDPVQALDDIFQARNRDHAVTVSIEQAQVRIGVDQLRFGIRSSRPGYVYVLMVGTDRSQFWLLYPNSLDANNSIEAGQQLDLPGPKWRMVAEGPPGTDQFVAIVSESPRDFSSAGLKKLAPFAEFPMSTAAQVQSASSGTNPVFAGRAKCESAQKEECPQAFGAAVFSIAEIPK